MLHSQPITRVNAQRNNTVIVRFRASPVKRWWLKHLAPGFHHVDLALYNGEVWLLITSHQTLMDWHVVLDVYSFLAKPGTCSVFAEIQENPPQCGDLSAFCQPFSCVTLAKRFLSIYDASIFTPYQLYRRIS